MMIPGKFRIFFYSQINGNYMEQSLGNQSCLNTWCSPIKKFLVKIIKKPRWLKAADNIQTNCKGLQNQILRESKLVFSSPYSCFHFNFLHHLSHPFLVSFLVLNIKRQKLRNRWEVRNSILWITFQFLSLLSRRNTFRLSDQLFICKLCNLHKKTTNLLFIFLIDMIVPFILWILTS